MRQSRVVYKTSRCQQRFAAFDSAITMPKDHMLALAGKKSRHSARNCCHACETVRRHCNWSVIANRCSRTYFSYAIERRVSFFVELRRKWDLSDCAFEFEPRFAYLHHIWVALWVSFQCKDRLVICLYILVASRKLIVLHSIGYI